MARKNAVDLLAETLQARKAKDPCKSGWIERHRQALARPYGAGMAIRMMLQGLAVYAQNHFVKYGASIGDDGVLGECWLDSLKGVRGLLNGELDGLDGGTMDAAIVALALNEGLGDEF